MKSINKQIQGETLFAGIDQHKRRWHITIRTTDVEIFSSSITGRWQELKKVLDRYKGCQIHAVYEAGYFGFSLFDKLIQYGVDCIVTPPSLIPQEYGTLSFIGMCRTSRCSLRGMVITRLLKSTLSQRNLNCSERLMPVPMATST